MVAAAGGSIEQKWAPTRTQESLVRSWKRLASRKIDRDAFAALVAITLVVFAVVLRAGVTGPSEIDYLKAFAETFNLDIGPETEWFGSGITGDGAASILIAVDPLGSDVGRALFVTSYRYGRAGYSWLASAIVVGQDRLVLLGLSGVGLASIACTGWIAARLRERRGLWAWSLALNPALYVGFISTTAEPMALALVSINFLSGSLVAGLGVALVRETYVVALASKWYLFIVALAMAVLFRACWVWRFRGSFAESANALAIPFQGVIAEGNVLGWLVVSAGLATLVFGIKSRDIAWIISGLLVVSFSADVLVVPIHAVRAAGMLPVLWAFGPRPAAIFSRRQIGIEGS